jgi:DNA polymerase phi
LILILYGDLANQFSDGFFSKNASESQKFTGFVIFQKMLEASASSPHLVESLFSKNFMACLMNQASKEDRYLHRAAIKSLKAMESAAQSAPSTLPTILTALLGANGAYSFDQRTNTKTMERLLQYSASSNAPMVISSLRTASSAATPSSIQTYGNYLFKLASLPPETATSEQSPTDSITLLAIQELAKVAYAKLDGVSSPEKTRDILRGRLTSVFAKLVKKPEDFVYLCDAVLAIEPDLKMDEELKSHLVKALERLQDLLDSEDVAADLRTSYQAIALLHAVGVLQLYNEDPDALETLNDLEVCYNKLQGEAMDDEVDMAEFLVEILLSMVSRPSILMRQVSLQVFDVFTSQVSAQAIKLLTDPLMAEESAKGQEALFQTEDEHADVDDSEDESSDDSDEESLDSDVEVVDVEDASSDDHSVNETGDVVISGINGSADELEALDVALAQVLGTHRLDQDAQASSDDDSDMSDSEMMELDSKLVEIFKQRTANLNKKKENKDAKETVVNFKRRVLDLISIFVKKEAAASNPLAFIVLLPLLQLIRTTSTKELASKACDIILNLSKSLKKSRGSGSQDLLSDEAAESMMLLLQDIHSEASQDPSHAYAKAASAASQAVASSLCSSKEWTEKVFQLYATTQLKWFTGEIRLQPSFFSDWLNWCQGHALTMATQEKD